MKKISLSLLFSVTTLVAFAQGNGKVSGTIKEAESSNPVEFATVALNDPATNKPIDGTIADAKGKFTIKGINNGKYVVAISFIGFETIKREIEITDKNWDVDLGTVLLSSSTEVLEAVTVEAQKTLIEEKVDRMIYNAENDNTAKGGDASDVLKRVPLLTVDLDGNVSIRGSQNIRVLVNNRPSTITAGSVADALKQIPADEIKSVEVITSPSSKYDAEGTTGIINIITKKNVLEGATLNVNGSVGNRGSNLGLRGGYKKGKLGLSVGGWGRFGYNTLGSFENSQGLLGTDSVTVQSADTRNNSLRANYSFGIDYDFNPKNFITSSIRLGSRGSKDYQDNLTSISYAGETPYRQTNQNVVTDNKANSVDVNLNFTHLYEKKDRELSFLGLYSIDDGINDFENITFDPTDFSSIRRIKNDNDSYNEEYALQVDYQTPVLENQLLEVGGKQTRRKALSNYEYFSANGDDPYEIVVNDQLSNVFNYIQNVSAAYLSYTVNLKKYAFKAGGRYEYTTIDAYFKDEQDIKIPSYGIFVPSINVSKRLANNNMIKAAFNRRIQRPSIRYLNPNIQGSNPLNYTVGNPSLDPEYTNNIELSYSTYVKGLGLNLTGFVRNSNNSIQRVSTRVGNTDIVENTYDNIGIENSYGTSINANLQIGDKLTFNGGPEIYYATLTNNVPDDNLRASNEGWVVSGRLFGSYNMTKEWSLQFFSFARGKNVLLQGFQGGFGMYSLGISKNLPNKRGSIGFGAENFFGKTITVKSETTTNDFVQTSTSIRENLNFKVNVNLRFGKIEGAGNRSSGSRRSRKSINSDDLKQGGDGGGGFDAGGQDQQGGQPGGGFAGAQGGARPAGAAVAVPAIISDPTAVVEAAGTWAYTIESPQGANGGTLKITKDGDAYSGTIINSRMQSEAPIKDIQVNGNELSFNYETSFGPNTNTITVKGVITADEFTGVMTVGQFGSFPMKAKRGQ